MRITRFEDIDGWKAARRLTNLTYAATKSMRYQVDPDHRRQIRRASTSSMANIAEGFEAGSPAEFKRFLRIG